MPGHIDSVDASQIVGWSIDLAAPDTLARVTCAAPDGQTLDFRTFEYRNDVVQATGRAGRFGFAIPTHLVAHLGQNLRFYDGSGQLLVRGDVHLPKELRNRSAHHTTYIFIHLQKTAGTSIRVALRDKKYEQSEVLLLYPPPLGITIPELCLLPLYQRRNMRFVAGHCYFGFDRYFGKQSRYFTIIREPMKRIESHYHHHMAAGTTFTIGGSKPPLREIVNNGLSEEFDNLMTRYIAGTASDLVPVGKMSSSELDLALYNVENYFDFVGDQGDLARDYPKLCRLLGVPQGNLARLNLRESDSAAAGDIDWRKVQRNNQIDCELYEILRMRAKS